MIKLGLFLEKNMDTIAVALDGGYAFLLSAQILIITGLMASLLWLSFRRLKEAHTPYGVIMAGARGQVAGTSAPHAEGEGVIAQTITDNTDTPQPESTGSASTVVTYNLNSQTADADSAAQNTSTGKLVSGGQAYGVAAGLEQKIKDLSHENENLRLLSSESQSLKEKVKFLESKVIEYEIIQEEMSILPMLKAENERLKKELGAVQAPTSSQAA